MLSVVSPASARRLARAGAAIRSLFGLVARSLVILGPLVPQNAAQASPLQQHLLFDGIDDEVVVPDEADFGFSAAVTLEAWIRPLSISATTAQDRVVSKSNALELTVSTGDTGCAFGTTGDVQWRATIAGLDRRILRRHSHRRAMAPCRRDLCRRLLQPLRRRGAGRGRLPATVRSTPAPVHSRSAITLSLGRNFDGGIDELPDLEPSPFPSRDPVEQGPRADRNRGRPRCVLDYERWRRPDPARHHRPRPRRHIGLLRRYQHQGSGVGS